MSNGTELTPGECSQGRNATETSLPGLEELPLASRRNRAKGSRYQLHLMSKDAPIEEEARNVLIAAAADEENSVP